MIFLICDIHKGQSIFFFLSDFIFWYPLKLRARNSFPEDTPQTMSQGGIFACQPLNPCTLGICSMFYLEKRLPSFFPFIFLLIGFASLSLSLFVFYQILLKFQRSAIPFLPTSPMQKLPIVSLQCEFIQIFLSRPHPLLLNQIGEITMTRRKKPASSSVKVKIVTVTNCLTLTR